MTRVIELLAPFFVVGTLLTVFALGIVIGMRIAEAKLSPQHESNHGP